MRPVRIRRRSDGIIELRRTRLRDVALGPDAALLAAMLIGTIAFLTLVATTLVAQMTMGARRVTARYLVN